MRKELRGLLGFAFVTVLVALLVTGVRWIQRPLFAGGFYRNGPDLLPSWHTDCERGRDGGLALIDARANQMFIAVGTDAGAWSPPYCLRDRAVLTSPQRRVVTVRKSANVLLILMPDMTVRRGDLRAGDATRVAAWYRTAQERRGLPLDELMEIGEAPVVVTTLHEDSAEVEIKLAPPTADRK